MKSGTTRSHSLLSEQYKRVHRHSDVLEMLSLILAGLILFLLGWQFGRTSIDVVNPKQEVAGHSYNRFGRVKQMCNRYGQIELSPSGQVITEPQQSLVAK